MLISMTYTAPIWIHFWFDTVHRTLDEYEQHCKPDVLPFVVTTPNCLDNLANVIEFKRKYVLASVAHHFKVSIYVHDGWFNSFEEFKTFYMDEYACGQRLCEKTPDLEKGWVQLPNGTMHCTPIFATRKSSPEDDAISHDYHRTQREVIDNLGLSWIDFDSHNLSEEVYSAVDIMVRHQFIPIHFHH